MGTREAGDLENWREELVNLWVRVWIAANKAAALLVAVAIHKVIDLAAEWLIPPGWEYFPKLIRAAFFAAFAIIYLHFLWEMLTVFVPSLKKKNWKRKEEPK